MMNCMMLLGESLAIRADHVRRVHSEMHRTSVTMEDGTIYRTDLPVSEVAKSINAALNAARAAGKDTSP